MGPLLLIGAALDGAAMYLLDPQQGRRRRARLIDQGKRAQTRALHVVDKGKRDLANRAGSIAGRARSMLHRREPAVRPTPIDYDLANHQVLVDPCGLREDFGVSPQELPSRTSRSRAAKASGSPA